MVDLGKLLVLAGALLLLAGAAVWALARLGFRGLPGDVRYQGEHVRFYFPVVTCLVVSVILTALLWLWRRFTGR